MPTTHYQIVRVFTTAPLDGSARVWPEGKPYATHAGAVRNADKLRKRMTAIGATAIQFEIVEVQA